MNFYKYLNMEINSKKICGVLGCGQGHTIKVSSSLDVFCL